MATHRNYKLRPGECRAESWVGTWEGVKHGYEYPAQISALQEFRVRVTARLASYWLVIAGIGHWLGLEAFVMFSWKRNKTLTEFWDLWASLLEIKAENVGVQFPSESKMSKFTNTQLSNACYYCSLYGVWTKCNNHELNIIIHLYRANITQHNTPARSTHSHKSVVKTV